MANNISQISYSNTFAHWLIATNQLIDNSNSLKSSSYTKESGTLLLDSSGTGLIVSNTAAFAGNVTISGTSKLLNIYNATNLYNTLTIAANTSIVASGNITSSRLSSNSIISNTVFFGNTTANYLNVNTAIFNSNSVTINQNGTYYKVASINDIAIANSYLRSYTDSAISSNLSNNYVLKNNGTATGILSASSIITANLTVTNTFITLGASISDSRDFKLQANTGSSSSPNSNIIITRSTIDPNANNATLRWYNLGKIWQISDVDTNLYYKIISTKEFDPVINTVNSNIANANSFNLNYTNTVVGTNNTALKIYTNTVVDANNTALKIYTNTVVNSNTTILNLTIANANSYVLNYCSNAYNISTGIVPTARLGTGTANSTTVLLGNGTWGSYSSGASLTDDTSTNASYYLGMSSGISGSWTTAYISSSKLYFNPSTGTLNSVLFNSLSDISQKYNVTKIDNSLDVVSQLKGVEFLWKETNKKSSGIIAQELGEVLPHLVDSDQTGLQSVNYNGIIGYLIEAIKELKIQIEELKNKDL